MSYLKPFTLACMGAMLAISGLISASCSGATAYKPSGLPERIAFASNRDKAGHIYTIKPDGTDIQATSSDNHTNDLLPSWSPDGVRLAFTSDQSEKYEIWSMQADGSNRSRLTGKQSRSSEPRWSPDGSRIVFISQVLDSEGIPNFEIFIINADGSGLQQLTDSTAAVDPPGSNGEHEHSDERILLNVAPTWSPDGTRILFASNRAAGNIPILYTMNTDGSEQKKFGLFSDVDGTEPDWSPLTNKIVFTRGNAVKLDIWVMDGGSPFPLLTAKKLTDNIDNNRRPVWSPDGKQIAYISDANSNQDIYIMNADGSNVRRLTYDNSAEGYPAWRP